MFPLSQLRQPYSGVTEYSNKFHFASRLSLTFCNEAYTAAAVAVDVEVRVDIVAIEALVVRAVLIVCSR